MPAKKRPRNPIYFEVVRAVDPGTGEAFGALRPLHAVDQRAMKDRKYAVGTHVRCELKKPRNVKFHRLAHGIGALCAEQLDDFHGFDAHSALKKLQGLSGAACHTVEYEIEGLGKLMRTEPRSIAFDEMDEGDFQEAVKVMYTYLQAKYWPHMDEEGIQRMVEMYEH